MLRGSSSPRTAVYECWEKKMTTLGGTAPGASLWHLLPSKDGKMMFRGVDKPWWGNEPEFSGQPFWGHFSLALKCKIMFHT